MSAQPIGTITSSTASLIVVMFDAASATAWVPTKPAATKAQFTGHPAEIMRGLAKGEDVAPVDVGASSGLAFELEGRSGKLDAYRLAGGTLALIAPPRAWWLEHHADHAPAIDALFAQAQSTGDDANDDDVGELELASGALAIVYLWHKKVGAARELASTITPGGALPFGDGYGDAANGLLVELGAGSHTVTRRAITAPWDPDATLVAMFVTPRS